MKYYIVDAFTSEPFGGNTAGVVMLEDGKDFPEDAFMQQLDKDSFPELALQFCNGEENPAHFLVIAEVTDIIA